MCVKNQQNELNSTGVFFYCDIFTYMFWPVIWPSSWWLFCYKNSVIKCVGFLHSIEIHMDAVNMVDIVSGTKCCASNPLNYTMLDDFCDCEKCTELETQLWQIREELSSVQLIVQLLNKDHMQGLTITTPIQEMETTGEVKENWVMMMAKGDKNRSIGNINPRRKKQTLVYEE